MVSLTRRVCTAYVCGARTLHSQLILSGRHVLLCLSLQNLPFCIVPALLGMGQSYLEASSLAHSHYVRFGTDPGLPLPTPSLVDNIRSLRAQFL